MTRRLCSRINQVPQLECPNFIQATQIMWQFKQRKIKMQSKTIKEQIDSFGVCRLRGAQCKGIPWVIDFTNPPYDLPKMWLISPIQTSINQGYLRSSHYLS